MTHKLHTVRQLTLLSKKVPPFNPPFNPTKILQKNAKVEGDDQTKKNPVSEPKSAISGQKQGLSDLRHLGLEPKTHGLRVRCSTN